MSNGLPEGNPIDTLSSLKLTDASMVHLYRGELSRSDVWRSRLDTTTNWALTVTAATISFSFGSTQTSHATLLAGIWLVVTFLFIETRRYRYYDLWYRRLRLLEDGFWSPMLRQEPADPDALRELAIELDRPQLQLSFFSALGTRITRAYGSLFTILVATWLVKLYSSPQPVKSVEELLQRAHVGPIPGLLVLVTVFLFSLTVAAATALSLVGRAPMGELQSRPRRRRLALSELFLRPYVQKPPRRRVPRSATPVQ